MAAQVKEFHKLPIINMGTIDEVMDDNSNSNCEIQEIKKFYKNVDEANREMMEDDSDEMVEQIFNYYEACKLD